MLAIDHEMRELLRTPGVRSVCLVDRNTGHTLNTAGEADRTADAVELLTAVTHGPLRHVGTVEDLVVTDHDHHLLFAPLHRSDLCLRVRMDRREGTLALALRRLRGLTRTAQPPPPRHPDLPQRGDHHQQPTPPRPRAASGVDRGVLERVLTALRTLAVPEPRAGSTAA